MWVSAMSEASGANPDEAAGGRPRSDNWVLGDEDRPPPHTQNRAAAYITLATKDLRDFAHVVVSISQTNMRASSIAIQF